MDNHDFYKYIEEIHEKVKTKTKIFYRFFFLILTSYLLNSPSLAHIKLNFIKKADLYSLT